MNKPVLKDSYNKGFALVATLLLMVLLAIIAVSLLSLSAVSLRSSAQGAAQAEAKANARMALMLAIGELQKHAGLDMRVTAPADVIDSSNPPLTGVWKSWEGSDHEASGILTGRPKVPNYSQKEQAAASGGRFLSWLVSGANTAKSVTDAASLVRKTPTGTSIPLVSTGSLATSDDRQVHVEPVAVNSNGKYAWWVSGDNQKARLPKPYKPKNDNAAEWSDIVRNHSVADPGVFELESLLTDAAPAMKTFTRNTADIYSEKDAAIRPSQSFHDLSATSAGLLTNTATGGWRKDFSLLTENWNAQPTSGLEFFKLTPTQNLQYTRPVPDPSQPVSASYNPRPSNSMLYHWADYRTSTLREFWARRGPIASWAKIKSYATLYKKMSSTTTNAPNINHQSWQDIGADTTQPNATLTFHDIRLMPQMARVQIVVSHYATTVGAEPGKYRPAVLYTPVVTVWNPYNTRLTLNGTLIVNPAYTLPLALNHKLSGAGAPFLADEYWSIQGQSSLKEYQDRSLSFVSKSWDMIFNLRQNPMILEPGETRIFSPAAGTLTEVKTGRNYDLYPGVRTGVGLFFPLDQRLVGVGGVITTAAVSLPGSVNMNVDAKFDVPSRYSGGNYVCGSAYQWFVDSWGSGRSHSWFQIFYKRQDANTLYPPKLGLASATLAECALRPVPFLSMTLGSRIANHRAIATKGMVQAEPVVDFFSSNGEPRFTDIYPGNDTLINTPWDFSVVEHASAADDMLPNVDTTTQSSYIVTGVRKAEGVSRMVTAELPARPLVSLADLTHMQIRALNPTPPYSGNIVANSDASPLIPKDNIVNPANTRANRRDNEQQDDSYCANHVLFDDWFFSSIAPKPTGFGPSGGTDLRQTYLDLLTGKEPLVNRAYRPIAEDRVSDDTAAGLKYTSHVQPAESWKTIASRLEVEGMFNVNSTSVRAWRALLGHARSQKIPYTQPSGAIKLSNPADYAISRTSVAGDRAAGEPPQVAGEYADTTEFTGHRVFTDEMLDKLAENIVGQVRARGPFLSLSEFVNRQLTNDNNLALAGAIQTALNQLASDSSLNPFQTIQNESVASLADPPGPEGYVFGDAAVGHNTYGLPGWTRQADILRPLAPVLSARDDTFTIRAYGDARSPDGKILARAWCEATVQRTRDFCDPADSPEIATLPTLPANQTFGRRFKLISFRWLSAREV
jgi:type II secretory pathway pseudopilin PulG